MQTNLSELLSSLNDMPERLSDLTGNLETTSRNAEPGFMKIGGELQSIHSNVKDLTQKTLQAVEFINTDSEDSVLLKIRKAVKDSFSELENCQTGLSEHLRHGNAIVKHLGDLYGSFASVKKIAKHLNVLGVYIRIESSRSSETFEMFEAVAQEIKQVSEKVGQISRNIRDELRTEQTNQITANKEISDGLEKLTNLAKDAEQTVKDAVREIEHITQLSSKILDQAVIRSEKISGQISELVVSIQFYDSMYQRMEHIVTAIRDVERSLKQEINTSEADDTMAQKWSSEHSILAIQAAQLERIISEIETVYQQSRNAFEKLIEEVDRLASDFSTHEVNDLQFRESRKGETSDSFEMLRLSLQNFNSILGQGQTLSELMEEAASRASLTANRLSDQTKHVHSINLDTHILALNSIVKAEHLGKKGENLKVLAHEITSLSDQTKHFVSSVEELLTSIISMGRQFHNSKSHNTQKEQVRSTADDTLDTSIQEISRSYDRFTEDSLDIYKQSEMLKNDILEMNTNLGFLLELAAELRVYFQQLKDIEKAFISFGGDDVGDDIGISEEISERYTMEKEREIHREIINIGQASHQGTNEEDGTECLRGREDTIKNNIELTPIITSEGDENEDDLGENVDLF